MDIVRCDRSVLNMQQKRIWGWKPFSCHMIGHALLMTAAVVYSACGLQAPLRLNHQLVHLPL
jgi:hypothetical protein